MLKNENKKNIKKLLNEIYNTLKLDNEMLEDCEEEYIRINIEDMRYINSCLAQIDFELCE
jgi:hypothetical protein